MIKTKIILLILSISLTPLFSFGQKWNLGPELGINLAPIENSDLGQNFRISPHFGVTAEYKFSDFFSLKSGIYGTQKMQTYNSYDSILVNLYGAEDLIGIDGINLHSYTKINGVVSQFYVELPILATYTYKRFSVFAGPNIGYMISARTKENKSVRTPFLQTVDFGELGLGIAGEILLALLPSASKDSFSESSSKDELRALEIAMKAGIRYDFDHLGINLNYFYGFTDFQTINKDKLENHSYLQLTLDYSFGLN